jgi:hypothetical protein
MIDHLRGAAVAALLTLFAAHCAVAQETPDTTRRWYDTIPTSRPRFARATSGERLALAAFTALALPVALAVGATTIVPPMVGVLREGEDSYVGITSGTGFGFGGDTMQLVYYPVLRTQFDIGYYFGRERPIIVHVALAKDLRIASLHPQDLFWLATAGGIGVMTDAHSVEPFVEAWVGLLNPLGIQFAPLFPMHNLGLRARVGYDVAASRTWQELSLGITSTFKW